MDTKKKEDTLRKKEKGRAHWGAFFLFFLFIYAKNQ